MGTTIRKPVAPFYAVAVLWLVCGLLVPFYKPIHYGMAAVISVVVFFAVQAVCRNGGVIGAEEKPKAEEKPAKAEEKKPEAEEKKETKPADEEKDLDDLFDMIKSKKK